MGDENALEARLERAHTVIGDMLRSLGEVDLLPERQKQAAVAAIIFKEEWASAKIRRDSMSSAYTADLASRIRQCDYIREFASWQGDGDWLADATDGEVLDQIFARVADADRLEHQLGTICGLVAFEKVGGAVVMSEGQISERVTAAIERARSEGRREADVERAALVAKLQLVREAVGAELRPDGTDDVVERARALLRYEISTAHEQIAISLGLTGSEQNVGWTVIYAQVAREHHDLLAVRAALPRGDEQVPLADRVAQLVREHGEMVAEMMKAADPEDIADAAATLAEPQPKSATELGLLEFIDVVFDGPPNAESGRFVEVEDHRGHSMRVGEWLDRGDGMWALRIPMQPPAEVGEVMAAAGALSALTAVVATSGMDWRRSPCLAWVYGVLVGHDRDVLEDLQMVFNWPDGTVDEIDRHRRALLAARGG